MRSRNESRSSKLIVTRAHSGGGCHNIINILADAFKRMAIAISMATASSIFMEFFIKPPLCVVTPLKCVYVMRVHAYT